MRKKNIHFVDVSFKNIHRKQIANVMQESASDRMNDGKTVNIYAKISIHSIATHQNCFIQIQISQFTQFSRLVSFIRIVS